MGDTIRLSEAEVALFDQQEWMWGRDVAAEGGNVMLEYGFRRYASGDPRRHLRLYRLGRGVGSLWVWPWGACYQDQERGGVLVRRFDPVPQAVRLSRVVYDAGTLQPRPLDEGRRVGLARAFAEIARYERWVQERHPEHRRRAADSWMRKACEGHEAGPSFEAMAAAHREIVQND